ncbi:MAG TPA: hypothetical protein VK674_02280 [Candidatus Limnocylindria bacterium]|nr:hypothetical protein [Candidatus Limnocylindria bacterium]
MNPKSTPIDANLMVWRSFCFRLLSPYVFDGLNMSVFGFWSFVCTTGAKAPQLFLGSEVSIPYQKMTHYQYVLPTPDVQEVIEQILHPSTTQVFLL